MKSKKRWDLTLKITLVRERRANYLLKKSSKINGVRKSTKNFNLDLLALRNYVSKEEKEEMKQEDQSQNGDEVK